MAQSPVKVSIIIPYRNKMELLNECLRTLVPALGDLRDLVEVILVDNGSSAAEQQRLTVPAGLHHKRIFLDVPFNFQLLNNAGRREASGQFLLLLNNDIEFPAEAKGFLGPMLDMAARPDVGAVGPLLFYPDGTIQHAGVVIGMNDYAEHLYRTWSTEQARQHGYVDYRQDRPVSAVTAAFLLVETAKFDAVGGMNEHFIVCGGDVDLCVSLALRGWRSVYMGSQAFVHHESKSRSGSAIPLSDFQCSRRSYDRWLDRHGGRDPYYPAPLPLTYVFQDPAVLVPARPPSPLIRLRKRLGGIRRRLRHEAPEMMLARKLMAVRGYEPPVRQQVRSVTEFVQPDCAPVQKHLVHASDDRPRLNFVLPHYDTQWGVYAGITTACILAYHLRMKIPRIDLRFVFVDGGGDLEAMRASLVRFLGDQVRTVEVSAVDVSNRSAVSLPVHERDFFVATAWWSCYQIEKLADGDRFIYLIQDFEPAFYPWGDRYATAQATYDMNFMPVFNTSQLREYFRRHALIETSRIDTGIAFEPAVDKAVFGRPRAALVPGAKRKLLFYAREKVARNLYATGVLALSRAIATGIIDPAAWEIISAGQVHDPVDLGNGVTLTAAGKLSMDEYAGMLSGVDVGLSLMLSPHPSYPPLEMAAAGVQVVTNAFDGKDMSRRSGNIISVPFGVDSIVQGLAAAVARVSAPGFRPEPAAKMDFPGTWPEALDPVVNHITRFIADEIKTRVSRTYGL